MPTKILAFDQSSRISGYFVCCDGKYIAHGKIDLHEYKDTIQRMKEMESRILTTIATYRPDFVVIEETTMQGSPATLRMLAQLQGVIIGYCHANNIPITTIYPTTWRKALNMRQGRDVKRNELKKQAIDFVKQKYCINVTDDEADAICIGLAYFILNKERNTSV